MGLSFHEMQAAAQEMSLRAVFDEDLSNYTLCDDGRYEVYTEYTDDAVSEVDKHKNITVNEEQCNLTQEENSQYVPFKLPRYWDGVDLMTKLIQFHYVNINGGSGVSTAVNVRFNDSYIICGWLINKSVTAVAGDVTFEITATGTNEKSADYRWRTRPNGKFTVLEALSYDGIIEPSDDWYAGFVKSMQEYTTKAAESARSAQDYADQSKSNLDQVTQITETFATNAQEVKETAINEINNAKVSGVNAVEAAAAEIVNDREKITENANNISSLQEDIAEFTVEGRNKYNPKKATNGYLSDTNETIDTSYEAYVVSDFIEVPSGYTAFFQAWNADYIGGSQYWANVRSFHVYNSLKNPISIITSASETYKNETDGTQYIRTNIYKSYVDFVIRVEVNYVRDGNHIIEYELYTVYVTEESNTAFAKIKEVDENVVSLFSTKGKNLLRKSKLFNAWLNTNGKITDKGITDYRVTPLFELPIGKTIFCSCFISSYGFRKFMASRVIAVYDKNGDVVYSVDSQSTSYKYTNETEKTLYVRFCFYPSNSGGTIREDEMVEIVDSEDEVILSDYEDAILHFNEDIVSDKANDYADKNIVRPCFVDEVENTVSTILSLTDKPCYTNIWLSDVHYDPRDIYNRERVHDTYKNIKAVCDSVFIEGISNTGDFNYPNDATITQAMSDEFINANRAFMLRACNHVYMVNGNHDGIGGSTPKTKNWNCVNNHNNDYVHRNGDNTYFYVDYPNINLRVFYIDTVECNDGNTTWGIGDTQLLWLKNNLLNCNYDVMFYAHFGTYGDFRTNLDNIRTLLNDYHNHTGEFSNKTSNCIAWLCGHEHIDGTVKTSESGLDFPVVVVTSSRLQSKSTTLFADYIPLDRKVRTVTQDAWDIVIYRPDENKIYFVRFGAGEDREIDLSAWDTTA